MPVKIFFCYAHEDEPLLKKLKTQLRPLQRQGLVDVWYDRDINAGAEWEREIDKHLSTAQIILLLVSPDFMNSDYCYGKEMKRALERHQRGEAKVIPIILRPVHWQGALGNLQALPIDAIPVTSSHWHNLDEALFDIADGIRKVAEELMIKPLIGIHAGIRAFKRIDLIKEQFRVALLRTTHISLVDLHLLIRGVDSLLIQKMYICGLDTHNLCCSQLVIEMNWDIHQQQILLGRISLTTDERWTNDTAIELDETIRLFDKFGRDNLLSTIWYTINVPQVFVFDANLYAGIQGFTKKARAENLRWKSQHEGTKFVVPELPEFAVSISLLS